MKAKPICLPAPRLSPAIITLFALAGMAAMPFSARAEQKEQWEIVEEIVDLQTALAKGPNGAYRVNQAKGTMATGIFTPSPKATSLTKAAHVRGGDIPVLVRFSRRTGNPNISDIDPGSRPLGFSIRFTLPKNTYTDIVGNSYNGFAVSTPEQFLEFLKAVRTSGPETPKPTPLEQFLEKNPSAMRAAKAPKPAPTSFTKITYYGVNSFKFTNAKGVSRYGRYQIVPVAPEPFPAAEEVAKRSKDYLSEELGPRLSTEPAKFKLMVQLPEAGDVINDGATAWPDSRPQVELGTITLTQVVTDSRAEEAKIVFNPLALPDGIAPSEDPILLSRPEAYAIAHARRKDR